MWISCVLLHFEDIWLTRGFGWDPTHTHTHTRNNKAWPGLACVINCSFKAATGRSSHISVRLQGDFTQPNKRRVMEKEQKQGQVSTRGRGTVPHSLTHNPSRLPFPLSGTAFTPYLSSETFHRYVQLCLPSLSDTRAPLVTHTSTFSPSPLLFIPFFPSQLSWLPLFCARSFITGHRRRGGRLNRTTCSI